MDDRAERRQRERRELAAEAERLRRQVADMAARRPSGLFTLAGVRGTLATYERMLGR